MALSGSFYSYPVNSFGVYCSWSAVQSVSGYYSDVTIKTYIQHYSITAGARTNSTIKCGSETYTYSSPALSYPSGTALTKTLIGSKTFRVYHDVGGGAKNVVVSASWQFNGTYSGTYVGTITASATISLDAIPQQSAIASIIVDSNNKVTVNLTRYVSTFTHTVKFVFGSYSHTVGDIGTSTSYTIPLEWLKAIPNSATGIGTVQVTTLSSGSQVGSVVSKDFTVTVPDTVVPSISGVSWTKASSEPSSWPITKSVSRGTMRMTGVAGAQGSTIVAHSLTFAGLSSNTDTLTVNNIATSGTLKAVAKVVDSRGRSFTKEVNFTVADYSKPTLEVIAYRCNNLGQEDAEGDSMFVKATANVTAVGNNLLDTLMLYYKRATDSSYEGLELTSGDENILSSISSDSTWEWRVVAGDFVNSVEIKGSIPTADVILDILANGRGIKLGGVAEGEGFDSAWPFKLNGVPQVDFVTEQGTSGIWTYRKWANGTLEAWTTGEFSFTATPAAIMGGYYSTYTLELPPLFYNTPTCFVHGKIGTGIGYASILSRSKTSMGLGVFGNQNNATSYITSVYAIGRWK